jgi:hypothetical protein
MISKQQLAEEQRKEREYNKLFDQVISKSPFANWYPLMIGASNLLTKNLPKRVGVDTDGRPIVVYKSTIGKVMGVWAEPTHKVIARDLGKKQFGKALGALLGIGQIQEMQRQKKAKFFDISPKEVQEIRNKRIALANLKKKQAEQKALENNKPLPPVTTEEEQYSERTVNEPTLIEDKKTNYAPVIILSLIGIAVIIGIATHGNKLKAS